MIITIHAELSDPTLQEIIPQVSSVISIGRAVQRGVFGIGGINPDPYDEQWGRMRFCNQAYKLSAIFASVLIIPVRPSRWFTLVIPRRMGTSL